MIFEPLKLVEGNELPGICIKLRSESLKVQFANLQLLNTFASKEHFTKMQSMNSPVNTLPESMWMLLNL